MATSDSATRASHLCMCVFIAPPSDAGAPNRMSSAFACSVALPDPLLGVPRDVGPGRFVRFREQGEDRGAGQRRLIRDDVIPRHAVLRRLPEREETLPQLDLASALAADDLAVAHAPEVVREA